MAYRRLRPPDTAYNTSRCIHNTCTQMHASAAVRGCRTKTQPMLMMLASVVYTHNLGCSAVLHAHALNEMMMIIYTRARAPPHRRAVHGLGPCGHDSQSTSHGTSTAYTVPAPQISNQSEGIGAQFSSMHKQHARQAQHAGRHMAHAARMAGTVHTHTRSATPGRAPEHDSASLLGCRMQPQDTCTPGPQLPHTPRTLPASPMLLSQPPHAL
jgi:hypothetical protein